jgi:hypothetical protein
MTKKQLSLARKIWAVGALLVVLSWFRIVSNTVGWIGFVIGMSGTFIASGLDQPGDDSLTEKNKSENS